MHRFAPRFALLLLLLSIPAGLFAEPPKRVLEAAARPVVETLHGVEVVDPYRWLEGSAAPEFGEPDPALDARVAEWTAEQNAVTRRVLDTLPGRGALEARLSELLEVPSVRAPEERGGLYFYGARQGKQAQTVLWVRRGAFGEPRELLNPNTLDPDGLTSLDWVTPSPDGSLVAIGLYRGGDENAVLYVLRSEDGAWLADEIPGKVEDVRWMPDGKSFLYRRLAEVENPYSAQIKYHRVGGHHRFDPILFEQYKEGPLATTWGPYAAIDEQGHWLVMTYYTGTDSNDVWAYDLAAWLESGEEPERIDLLESEKSLQQPLLVGDTLYLHTTLDAPNGRVLAIDLNHPEREHWREVIAERPGAVLEAIDHGGEDFLVGRYLEKAATRIALFDLDGAPRGDLDLPGIGTARLNVRAGSSEAFLTFESYNTPESIYRVDLTQPGERELWERPDVPVDPSSIEVRQVSYPSRDGTQVTMFLIHRKGLELTAKTPTILYGYGGFNISVTPSFSSTTYPWVEAGGLYAAVNLRGGGEYGEAWHRAGMLDRKQNVFDDFIAAAEWLIAQGYTSSEHLGVFGGSNGGLLTGAVLVQRPELFSAVISAVPLLDMLRYQHFLMARYWVPEYGSAEDAEQFAFLRAYSPYHNVRPKTAYPATLLTAGENDSRVHPLHARKMAARLQAATTSDPAAEPILLWVEGDAGHGAGKPFEVRLRDAADRLSFFGRQLGLAWESPE